MIITFKKLKKDHFPLLLRWLEKKHVKQFWDTSTDWDQDKIENKYIPYTQGYKILGEIKKPMHAYVICANDSPVGYIQYYNKYDFPPEQGYEIDQLPKSLGAIDFYIGEPSYLGKGLGSRVIDQFCKEYVFKDFDNCFVDPETNNIAAIKTYSRAGFKIEKPCLKNGITFMLNSKNQS